MDQYMTTEEAADLLKISVQTVLRWINTDPKSGETRLAATKVGKSYRIRRSDVERLLGNSVEPERTGTGEVIAVTNQKGGVGKTTTAINLAAALGKLGNRVLLIDLDPQGGCAASLGIDIEGIATMYNVLVTDTPITKVLMRTSFGFDLAPSDIDLAGAEFALKQMLVGEMALRRKLDVVIGRYDFIIIDCPPSLGLLTLNALAAATSSLVPVSCEYLPIKGLEMLLDTIDNVRDVLNTKLHITGIVVTQFKSGTLNSKEMLQAITNFAQNTGTRLFPYMIKQSVRVTESASFQKPFVLLYPNEDAALAYMEVARAIQAKPATAAEIPGTEVSKNVR